MPIAEFSAVFAGVSLLTKLQGFLLFLFTVQSFALEMGALEKVSQFIRRHAMLEGARGVVVAVSGGPDSVALVDLLARLLAPETGTESPGIRVLVAHLNHQLRGSESDDDAEFVQQLADRLALPVKVGNADVAAAARRAARGIEEVAREIRYNFLFRVALASGCDRIATGHTMNDQAETFLIRLARGSGLRGLSAMRPVIPAHFFEKSGATEESGDERGKTQKSSSLAEPNRSDSRSTPLLIRPLLSITREEVTEYCRQRSLEFRNDTTNLSVNYTRNRIRIEVMPALRKVNRRVVESIARAAENIAADEEVLDDLGSSLLGKARLEPDAWLTGRCGAAYSVASMLEQPSGMRRRIIIEAVRATRNCSAGGKGDATGEVTSAHVAAVEALLKEGASGSHICLPCSLEVWRDFNAIVFRPVAPIKDKLYRSSISVASPHTEAGEFAFNLRRGLPVELLNSVMEDTKLEKHRTGHDWMTVALDDRALPEDLVIRPRIPGERSLVLGKRRTIKLKNLMIDHRIPSSRRGTWPLVTTPDGRYIWSPGLPPAVEFAAHNETLSLAIMRASAV